MAGRRAVEIVVGLFALLGFVCVPLGSKTGLEHLLAIASTDAARSATHDLIDTVLKARERLLGSVPPREPVAVQPQPSSGPRAKLPRLGH